MDLLSSFKRYIKERNLFGTGDKLIIATSGGVDSVVLCELCQRSGFSFVIAHANFGLRGKESEQDEAFVCSLAESHQVPFFLKTFDTRTMAAQTGAGIQETARLLRYQWFAELAGELKSGAAPVKANRKAQTKYVLLTAHHADDQAETVLMNFCKGTGIAGVRGMQNPAVLFGLTVVRPLLFAWKTDILAYAASLNLSYREDSSNASTDYTRNYFRKEVIPVIASVMPGISSQLVENADRFSGIEQIYQQALATMTGKLLVSRKGLPSIPVNKLKKQAGIRTLLYEMTRPYGFTAAQSEDVARLLGSESGRHVDSPNHRIFRDRDWLVISGKGGAATDMLLIEEGTSRVDFPAGSLHIARVDRKPEIVQDEMVAMLDARDIVYPLLLRTWKQGDYFYPLGMRKKKKLSRFFIDQKMSVPEKEKTWVIESGKRIIWVVGKRIDDRFRIGESTTTAIKISFSPAPGR